MRLHATIADYQPDILIHDDGSRVHAEIDGRGYTLEVRETGVSGYVLMADAAVFDCRVDGRADAGKSIRVIVGATEYSVTLDEPKRLPRPSAPAPPPHPAAPIPAPLPCNTAP